MLSWRPKDIADVPDGLILFDGVCVLCSGWVRFVVDRDRGSWFRFAPIQSPYGRALADRLVIDAENPQTNAVIVRGRAHFKFDTVIEVLSRLPGWRWARVFTLLPRPLRNFVYDRVARNRYRLFGRTETCMVPKPEVAKRFVHDAADAALPTRSSPFQFLLGDDFDRLPAMIRRVHAPALALHTAGCAEVSRTAGVFASLLCWMAGLPLPGCDIAVTVSFYPDGPLREFWQRRFGDRRYASTLRAGDPRAPGMLVEHFGPFDLEFRLALRADGLAWAVDGWRLCGVRLPAWTTPRIACLESVDGERFLFDIDVAFPLIGHVIHYRGWLEADRRWKTAADRPANRTFDCYLGHKTASCCGIAER